MSGFATVALLLMIAAWARPQPRVRKQHSTQRLPRRRWHTTRPPTVDEWAAFVDAMSSEVRTGRSLAAAVR